MENEQTKPKLEQLNKTGRARIASLEGGFYELARRIAEACVEGRELALALEMIGDARETVLRLVAEHPINQAGAPELEVPLTTAPATVASAEDADRVAPEVRGPGTMRTDPERGFVWEPAPLPPEPTTP